MTTDPILLQFAYDVLHLPCGEDGYIVEYDRALLTATLRLLSHTEYGDIARMLANTEGLDIAPAYTVPAQGEG